MIQVKGLTKRFGQTPVVGDLSFEVTPGVREPFRERLGVPRERPGNIVGSGNAGVAEVTEDG